MTSALIAAEGVTAVGSLTAEQAGSINDAFVNMGTSVLGNFISLLPTVAAITGIAFVIYWVNKRANKMKKGK